MPVSSYVGPEVEVLRRNGIDSTVRLPGSKSYTNRQIAISALADEPSVLVNALLSDDTRYLAAAVEALGAVRVVEDEDCAGLTVDTVSWPPRAPSEPIFMGNAGTGVRVMLTLAGFARGRVVVTGNERMRQRPMGDLLAALRQVGIDAQSLERAGSPPIAIVGSAELGGSTSISGAVSSQFITSLLLCSVRFEHGLDLTVLDDPVSRPYLDMTIAAMAERGVTVEREGYRHFSVAPGQSYTGGRVPIEPDASNMSYFLGAAAILGGRVLVEGIGSSSVQGDTGLVGVFERMGCSAHWEPGSVRLDGAPLHGIEVDMSTMPDVAPTLAVVAAFAEGTTSITGIGTLRDKECDRIRATTTELRKMGVIVDEHDDAMDVHGGEPHGAEIDTYDDHRMAMSFAMAGLAVDGVTIRDPGCVAKSFPTFWTVLDGLG